MSADGDNQDCASSSQDEGQGAEPSRGERIMEVARLFTRLGFTAFGGPAAHVGMIEDEVVTRRGWVDRRHFLDLVASVNFIPGPNSTELAIHLGLIRAGYAGLVTAGVCFIVPAVLIILPLAWLYVHYGTVPHVQPALRGIGAAVVAIVGVVTVRFAKTSVRHASDIVLACVAFGVSTMAAAGVGPRGGHFQPELLSLGLAVVCGCAIFRRKSGREAQLAPGVLLAPAAFGPAVAAGGLGAMAIFFLKVGATLFGSGYVLISYLQSGLVDERHWLTQRQLLDAVAVGQFTPGPLLTTATFIGYVLGAERFAGGTRGGVIGAMVATAAIFAPSFVFVALLGPLLNRIRRNAMARAALDSMNAAVSGLLAAVAVRLAIESVHGGGHIDWVNVAIIGSALVLLLQGVNATWLVLGGGLVGSIAG